MAANKCRTKPGKATTSQDGQQAVPLAVLLELYDTLFRIVQGARVGLKFPTPFAFVSAYGQSWQPQAKPGHYKWMEQGNCFGNAFTLADENPDLTYVEGYALNENSDKPILHAWAADREGRVVDATWRKPGVEYFGVAFTIDDVLRSMHIRQKYGVIDNWECGWPLLRTGYRKATKK